VAWRRGSGPGSSWSPPEKRSGGRWDEKPHEKQKSKRSTSKKSPYDFISICSIIFSFRYLRYTLYFCGFSWGASACARATDGKTGKINFARFLDFFDKVDFVS
jgi:hypothetical protein